MRKLAIGLMTVLVAVAFAVPVHAQVSGPKITIHVKEGTKNACGLANQPIFGCSGYTQSGVSDGTVYAMYLVVADGPAEGVGGAAFGVSYDPAILIGGWTSCADQDFTSTSWPESGSSGTIAWDVIGNCQNTVIDGEGIQGVLGWMYTYAYSPGFFTLTPRTEVSQPIIIVKCDNNELEISQQALGAARYTADGSVQGCNPCTDTCMGVPVEHKTWGAIKRLSDSGE